MTVNIADDKFEDKLILNKVYWVVYVTDEQPGMYRFTGKDKNNHFLFKEVGGLQRTINVQSLDYLAGLFYRKPTWKELVNTGAWQKDTPI